MDLVYTNAFSEVLEILFYLSKEEYNRIPKSFLKMIEENCNPDYEFFYYPEKTLDEQKVLKETKIIISLICRDFLVSEDEKKRILEKEKAEMENYERIQNEKYSYDKLFNNNESIKTQEPSKEINNSIAVIENKNYFVRIIEKIKNFLFR